VAQVIENLPSKGETQVQTSVPKQKWKRNNLKSEIKYFSFQELDTI
jgi:hypothetical protein